MHLLIVNMLDGMEGGCVSERSRVRDLPLTLRKKKMLTASEICYSMISIEMVLNCTRSLAQGGVPQISF